MENKKGVIRQEREGDLAKAGDTGRQKGKANIHTDILHEKISNISTPSLSFL